ncbi:ATP-dependent helicase [Laceyella putida]|uniref:DNA 3'-5' helicase n=1 Tax=Laceyella putida TaxID=110101 RepID=A0ABW2RMJ4_9BACL
MQGMEMLLSGLNEAQRQAVTAPAGPTVVFAGPGSGKTTVLTRRVLYLLEQGIPANQLMLVTFTRAAAREMRERLEQVMPTRTRELAIGTFHALFLQMLRESGQGIPPLMGQGEQTGMMRELLAERELPTDEETISTYLNQIGLCKNNGFLPGRLRVEKQKNIIFRDLYAAYESKKAEHGVWDYDDILLAVYERCRQPEWLSRWQAKFQHILVDEFQDINRVQYEILVKLAAVHQHLFVVGDDDQAIYGFRGSDPKFMLELNRDFPGLQRIVLSINYRSTEELIQATEQLIRHNRQRQQKPRAGTGIRGPGVNWLEPLDEEDEAEQILAHLADGMETAILYRTSTQARALIDALVRKGIPFMTATGESSVYRRWQVQDLFAYLKLAWNPQDLDALVRIINKPKRYLYKDEWIDECWAKARKRGGSLLAALPELEGLEPYQVRYLSELRDQVPRLSRMSATEAIGYIREQIGYDRYLETFAKETGNDQSSLFEPLDELVMAARHFSDGQGLLAHAAEVERRLHHPEASAPVKLMTLHRSKGLEFDRVYIIGLHAMVLPHHRSLQVSEQRKAAAWEEERRLFYVGMTRAKTECWLSISQTRQGKKVAPSPFAKELGYGEELSVSDPPVERKREIERTTRVFASARSTKRTQPQLRFAGEEVAPGLTVNHIRFGVGTIVEVTPLGGVAPGRKILVRFPGQTQSLHYELSRQLGLLSQPE